MWQLDHDLWVAGCPRDAAKLDARGITAVVTCSRKKPPLEAIDNRFWWYQPFPDGRAPQIERAQEIARGVREILDRGHVVLVHCLAGRNRSALVAALVLRERYHLTGVEAIELVRQRRPRALVNPVQVSLLELLP